MQGRQCAGTHLEVDHLGVKMALLHNTRHQTLVLWGVATRRDQVELRLSWGASDAGTYLEVDHLGGDVEVAFELQERLAVRTH
jgi:hypothetical protein